MKRAGILMMVMLAAVALLFAGCGGNDDVQQNPEQPQQEQQQNSDEKDMKKDVNPANADVQSRSEEIVTLHGQFQGLADGHSAEVLVEDEAVVFQFFDEEIASLLEIMEVGTAIQFDVETDEKTGVKTIVKLYSEAK